MSLDPSDPHLLFTPSKHAFPTEDRDPAGLLPRRMDYVMVPFVPAEERQTYKSRTPANCDEIVGEWLDETQNCRYYFARYQKGLAHKYSEEDLHLLDPTIVQIYNRRKAEGSLPPFDPSSKDVHPDSRVRKIPKVRARGATPTDFFESSSENDYDDDDEAADENYDSDAPRITRRSRPIKLPFSPRKTRSQRVFAVELSEEPDEDIEDSVPLRRSTRSKGLKVPLRQASEEDHRPALKNPGTSQKGRLQTKRVASSQPAYGNIRPIDDLDADDENENILHAHRMKCEKCHEGPTHILLEALRKKPKGRRKKPSDDDFEEAEDDLERVAAKGGWVRCLTCPVSVHFRCLAKEQMDEILKAARDRDRAVWLATQPSGADAEKDGPAKRSSLTPEQSTDFICGSCAKGGFCSGCMKDIPVPDPKTIYETASRTLSRSDQPDEGTTREAGMTAMAAVPLFRCFTCKRPFHYRHFPDEDIPLHQENWLCPDCVTFAYPVEQILAWRPYPPSATEPTLGPGETVNWRHQLPREYLIKWQGRSYRRTSWAPHMWLVSTHSAKLRNFLNEGSKVDLLAVVPKDLEEEQSRDSRSRDSSEVPQVTARTTHIAIPDAQSRIPVNWQTVDRVLDILIWSPKKNRNVSDEEYDAVFENGEQPNADLTQTLATWERGRKFGLEDASSVVWAFIKWRDLGYDKATWDTPPRPSDPTYPQFEHALKRFIAARQVRVPKPTKALIGAYNNRPKDGYKKHALQMTGKLELDQDASLSLMDFQVTGFDWLFGNWWNKQPCILADEMGLGKTVQIACFIGYVASKFSAFPALVVVPNSTITNWVREFERWAPCLTVVPFHGETTARDVIKNFELSHGFHVLITTYEAFNNSRDFSRVLKPNPWKILVIDEGQRLKSDSSLLFKKLNELDSWHRILLTGTPLNNNIRELFNLMNFLDPEKWNDLEGLEKEYSELTEDHVKRLHELLRPYFLRRIKSEVLKLPPKNEVIVPVSMAGLQKEVYRSILTNNAEILKGLTTTSSTNTGSRKRINNVLMQLRKCLQHPYLFSEDIEPQGLSLSEAHDKLIDASAKLRLLKMMLPKLKARGHRVLLFSQFVLALNIIEDFLNGEGIKYLRLDGNTKQLARQKDMDEFNRPGSDVFIYLLSTRAGGVGINLYTADTVIIFDPDFNPHQDLQAIARAYRFGQTKTCLVFKLMVKDSAEERIMQIGKKKLVLDHLIVQKMDDDDEDDSENVQSILSYGALALFAQDESVKEISYTDNDIESLIIKTEETPPEAETSESKSNNLFSFTQVWTAGKDALNDLVDNDQVDSWAETLRKITTEKDNADAQALEVSGRGTRRRATHVTKYVDEIESPEKQQAKGKGKGKGKSIQRDSEGSSYGASESGSNSSSDEEAHEEGGPTSLPYEVFQCGLCGENHGNRFGECKMVENSEYLRDYRLMLLLHADDEPVERRQHAIECIDHILSMRGHTSLVAGQPLHLIDQNRAVVSLQDGSSSTLKRANPGPIDNHHPAKKPRTSFTSCPVCQQSPPQHIELEDCPNLVGGSKSLTDQILRLQQVPGMTNVVGTLRKMLSKRMKAEKRAQSNS